MKRVISLLPSATEALCLIPGAHAMLVGRSHECDYPQTITHLPVLTSANVKPATSNEIDTQVKEAIASGQSLYSVNEELLQELQPDVILTQDICTVCSIDLQTVQRIAQRMQPQPLVVSLNPLCVEDVLKDVLLVGEAIGLQKEAQEARDALQRRLDDVIQKVEALKLDHRPEVAYLEWMSPIFVAGHWTPQLIEWAGGRHSLNAPGKYSIQKTPEELVASNPEFLIVCPCGYNIETIRKELGPLLKDQDWFQRLPAVQAGHAVVVDGNQMFNRPGPRLVDSLEWLAGWLHGKPDWIPNNFPVEPI